MPPVKERDHGRYRNRINQLYCHQFRPWRVELLHGAAALARSWNASLQHHAADHARDGNLQPTARDPGPAKRCFTPQRIRDDGVERGEYY